jgi:DNA polymerase V
VFALADCNNFYASCERIFRPELRSRPVLVLSNNDGCVVARSNEVKQLGIANGTPHWQIKELIAKHKIVVFSSNYQLYGDMSARVMDLLGQQCADLEVYSIDEAFMRFDFYRQTQQKLEQEGKRIKGFVEQCTGIPISIGFAPTKTLAKLANHISKKVTATGVHVIYDPFEQEDLMKRIDVSEVWGIGSAYKRKLSDYGIETVWQLLQCREQWFYKEFTIQGLRLLKELKGIPCMDLEDSPTSRQNMVVSRAFRRDVYALEELREAFANFATRLGEKLRRYRQITSSLSVFLLVNPYNNKSPDGRRYFSQFIQLPIASSNTPELINAAWKALSLCFSSGRNYKKCGIMAYGLQPEDVVQLSLFEEPEQHLKTRKLMAITDKINARFGNGTVGCAAAIVSKDNKWQRLEQFRSPRYTTSWLELLRIK